MNNQIELGEPFNDVYTTPAHNLKVFSNMSRIGIEFSGKITPLFPNMLIQAEGEGLGAPIEPQPTHSSTHPSTGDQLPVTESSSSHDTTQDSRDSLDELRDAQAAEIIALKARIKKLDKKCKPSISHHRAWLKSMQRLSMKKRFRKKELVSKQGRKKDKPKPTLDDCTFDSLDENLNADHGMDYIDTEEPVNEGRLRGSTEELVSTARSEDSTVRPDVGTANPIAPPPTTTTSIFDDEDITMAQTLIKMKEEKAKEKRVSIKDIEDSSRHARLILTLKPLPTIDLKEKGKGVLEEPEPAKKMTRRREEYTIEEKAKFLGETIAAQRRFRASYRSVEIRSRPQTKSQLRNLMTTYLKNMGGYKHSQLKAKTFVKIQGLYERQKRVIDDFKPMDSNDAVDNQKVLEEPNSTKVEVNQEGDEESIRKKRDSDLKEEENLKTFLQIVPDKEGEVDYEVLDKRFPIINRESKFYHLDRHGAECIYYRIFRSDGSSRWIKFFLKWTMFEETADDDLWKNQEEWILKSWNFYENCGVYTLTFEDGTEIYMLTERRYPLTKETLERMLALRLIAESKSEAVFDLLRFIQKQIDESGSHDESEKDFAPCYCNEALAIPEKTATDDKDWKLIKEILKELKCVWIHPPGVQEA
nr:hypothetical protein [Tanacetum cinerariifolium]